MPRTIQDAKLETRAARARLTAGKDHFKTLLPGKVHLGYRRRTPGEAGTWIVRVYQGKGPTGVSQYRLAPLAQDLPFEAAQKQALAHPLARGEAAPRAGMTVAEAVKDYVAWLATHRATSRDAALRAEKLILPALGRMKVAELTTARLSKWRDEMAAAPRLVRTKKGAPQQYGAVPTTKEEKRARRASANRVLTTLKAALNLAFRQGEVGDDTAWRRLKGFDRVEAARPGFLSVEEAQRVINAADAPSGFRDLVTGALMTGARFGELIALRCGDFAHGKVHVRTSKSGRPRDIVLTEEGQGFFAAQTAGRDPNAPLFPRADGGPWGDAMQARPMLDACLHAQINPPVGFHQLRHTWASLAVMNGVPLMIGGEPGPRLLNAVPSLDQIQDVAIQVQAFLFNVFGCLDNLAWMWVLERDIPKPDGTPLPPEWVGLRAKNTVVRNSLGQELRQYLESMSAWFDYLEDYRHALAHRIPLYVPPFAIAPTDAERYRELEQSIFALKSERRYTEAQAQELERDRLRFFQPWVKHSWATPGGAIQFHTQMRTDFKTIEAIGARLLEELAKPRASGGDDAVV
jgi:integrase